MLIKCKLYPQNISELENSILIADKLLVFTNINDVIIAAYTRLLHYNWSIFVSYAVMYLIENEIINVLSRI